MLRQIFRSTKNLDEWYAKEGEKIIELGKATDYGKGNGNDMVFKHPKTGEEIIARHGTTDKDGNFLRFCQGKENCEERTACINNEDYRSRAGYYADF